MSESSQAPAATAVAADKVVGSFWERTVDDIHRRPQYYVKAVTIIAVIAAIPLIGWKIFSAMNASKQDDVALAWQKATDSDVPAKQRAAQLEDLGAQLAGSPADASRLFELATTFKELADDAKTQEEKLANYQKAVDTCSQLESKYPNSFWAKMVTRPANGAQAAGQSLVAQVKENAQRQVDWLKAHPFVGAVQPDKNLKVTFELENGKKFVIGKFWSKVAPYHVKSFVWLARDKKYFEGTAFHAFVKGMKKTDASTMMQQPKTTNLGITGGDPMTKATPENRDDDGQQTNDVGYSIREEPNMLPAGRGSVLSVMDYTTGGDSPSRFTIYSDEPTYAQGSVFAEVTEGLEVIDELVSQAEDDLRKDRPKALVKVKSVTVEGDIDFPPAGTDFPPAGEFKVPESKPVTPESKPTDGK